MKIRSVGKVSSGRRKSNKLPKELSGLWDAQYKKREKALMNMLTPEAKALWYKEPYSNKIAVIDRLEAQGRFKVVERVK